MKNKSIGQFELRRKFSDAMHKGHFFVTISVLDRARKKIDHYYSFENFPHDELIHCLEHLALQIDKEVIHVKKDNP